MSEKLSSMPGQMSQYKEIKEQIYSNGAQHYRGELADGTTVPVAGDKVLDAYGYDPKASKESFDPIEVPVKETRSRNPIGRSFDRTGIKDMETASDKKIAEVQKQKGVEERRNSKEVSLLNDVAELRVYGSRGRTYTDPETGRVIADAKNPIKSVSERIMDEKGGTHAERTKIAKEYMENIDDFLSQDYELTQAEFLTELRMQDKQQQRDMVAQLISNGMDPAKATEKASNAYTKKEATRLKLVKENGYMTADEYVRGINGHPHTHGEGGGEGGDDKPTPLTTEQQEAIDRAEAAVAIARDRYIEVSSQGRKVAFGLRGDKRTSAEKDAEKEYLDALTYAGNLVGRTFEMQGFTEADIDGIAKLAQAKESEVLVIEGLQRRQEELANTKFMGRFNNWFTRQTADKEGKSAVFGQIKKAAAMATIGVGAAAGIGLGVAGGAAVGAIGVPALLAARFGKGQAVSRISKNANAATQANVHNSEVHTANLKLINTSTNRLTAEELIASTQKKNSEYKTMNRRRVIGSAVLGGGAMVAAEALANTGVGGSVREWVADRFSDRFPLFGGRPESTDLGDGSGSSAGETPPPASNDEIDNPFNNGPDDSVDPSDISDPSDGGASGELPPEVALALDDRTQEVLNTEGQYPWSRAEALYGGNDAAPRLMSAVEDLQSQGVDAQWVGNPLTDRNAYISINGQTDTSAVWQQLAPALAQQDLDNFFNSLSDSVDELPKTA